MRWAVLIALMNLVGCSGKKDAFPQKEQDQNKKAEELVTLDQFMEELAKSSGEKAVAGLTEAKQKISKLSKVDQEHEQRLLELAQTVNLDDAAAAYARLGRENITDPSNSPAMKYLTLRLLQHDWNNPNLRELFRWGWENLLTEESRSFQKLNDWLSGYSAASDLHPHLPELLNALRSKRKPSEGALKLYADIFGTTRYPNNW